MQKATTDDISAICSRIDAQTVIIVELLAELDGANVAQFSDKYRKRYDALAEKYRKGMVG